MSAPYLPQRLRAGDVVTAVDPQPLVLPPGTPARAAPCFTCGQAIGGSPALLVLAVPTGTGPCSCGRQWCAAYWTHATCDPGNGDAILTRAGQLARACLSDGRE